ncbi:hypothetical protein CYY_000183 [Polysphondylium violaceum]|uniref:Thioredoxin domain-containing protein n=1 Tax=Polysphondylium violaceum TaxID=133409 RepID=A0A8J4Q3E7_9MYCE|nr:hypothetical protein CYY_000183 [Polysphondylium violaceum]
MSTQSIISYKEEELPTLSISILKQLIKEAGGDSTGCLEKSDLVNLAKRLRTYKLSQVSSVKELKDNELEKELSEAGDKLVVVDFTAVWCPPCQAISPVFTSLASQYPNAVFLKVDVDKCRNTAAKCKISAMPTFQFYRSNKMVKEFTGADQRALKSTITELYQK